VSKPFSSARHQAAVTTATGYRRVTRCMFNRNGLSAMLEPVAGSFAQDARRSARWDGRLSFVGTDQFPVRPGDLLTPFGTTCSVELGLELLDGSISTVTYGTYEVAAVQTDTAAGVRTTGVSLIDLSDRVNRYRFERTFTTLGGIWFTRMINDVFINRTGISPNLPPGGEIILNPYTFGLETGTGPWKELLEIAESYGVSIWYDRSGLLQVGSLTPDVEDAYPLTGTVSLSADFDTQPANVWVVRGETQDGVAPVQAIAMDTDPGSPTYAGAAPGGSPYGRTTDFFSSSTITTISQAQTVANGLLAQSIGAGSTYTITWPYNPTVDAGDVVSIEGATYAIDSVTVDITGETTAKAREIR